MSRLVLVVGCAGAVAAILWGGSRVRLRVAEANLHHDLRAEPSVRPLPSNWDARPIDPAERARLVEEVLEGNLEDPMPLFQEEYRRGAFSPVADRQFRSLVRLDPWNPCSIEVAHRIVRGPFRPDVRYEALKLLLHSEAADSVSPELRNAVVRGHEQARWYR